MKKIVLLMGMLLAAVPMWADGRSDELIAALGRKIASMGDYNASFEVEAEGNRVDGTYTVSGDKYFMVTEEYEVVCDGRARYEVNHYDQEIVVDNVNPGDRNILSNPTRAFEFAPGVFRSDYKGEGQVGSATVDVVELTPLDDQSALQRVTVSIDRTSGLPVELRYLSDGLSEDVVVTITGIEKGLPKGTSFNFDRSRYKGYELVDFR